MQWMVLVEIVCNAIITGIATFTVDGSFFPDKSHLIAAHWRCSANQILLVTSDFISSIKL